MIRRSICLMLAAATLGCSSPSKPNDEERRRRPQVTAGSPLGIEYPDPMAIVGRVTGNMEAGDWKQAWQELCDLGRNGRPVPLVPGTNVPDDFPEDVKRRIRPFFQHFRGLERSWVRISYGEVRTLRNSPPMITVPVKWSYDLERVTSKEREVILHVWNKQADQQVDWNRFRLEMRQEVVRRERAADWPQWSFAWLDDRWRLYIGRPLR